MPLETASYISTLDSSNPAATDQLAQADDHIRLIKSVLKSTFPNLSGAMTATHTALSKVFTTDGGQVGAIELKALDGVNAGGFLTFLAPGVLRKTFMHNNAGHFKIYSTNNVVGLDIDHANGNLSTQGKLQEDGADLVPVGVITMWYGSVANVPAGWALCNGQVVNGFTTPNLVDRFVVGAGSAYAPGSIGGSNFVTATTSASGAHTHGGVTDMVGPHNHFGVTGGHALTEAEIPPHSHQIEMGTVNSNNSGSYFTGAAGSVLKYVQSMFTGGGALHTHGIAADGGHGHNLVVSATSDHNHSVTVDTRSPYMALCYIMKV
jgi:hypothetical protein